MVYMRQVIGKALLLMVMLGSLRVHAGDKIKYYFTQPVNNSVSKGVNAKQLDNCFGDTIVAYINRSKYTLDIAVYNYTSTFPAIAVAVNSAYLRGVRVRWIYDYSSSNTGIPLLNSGINRLASPPDAGNYTIMHNKFMVIDANSSNPNDAFVWTGSSNWNTQQFNDDYNNAVVIQDQALAKAYRAHFNMMWGDTGIAPNSALSKFGQYKTDLGAHNFTIEGKQVELYFSPADGVNSKIQTAINTANTDMYFGMSTFTYNSDASLLVTKHNVGVYVAGIDDGSASSSSTNSILSSGLSGSFKVYSGSYLYHNKFLIVDASNSCSDPLVLTGSHNWTVSADTKNDENTLIIHDDTAANIFYQSFYANFLALGGSLTSIPDCTTEVGPVQQFDGEFRCFPDPSDGNFSVQFYLRVQGAVNIDIFDLAGRKITSSSYPCLSAGWHTIDDVNIPCSGTFFLRCSSEANFATKVLTVNKL